ncbi:MAG TPA: beta (1-6) glucan synthase [Methylophilaceae bacterium]|nr:beta (1-6) glucan synthase [Methylophilaceae bacterium]
MQIKLVKDKWAYGIINLLLLLVLSFWIVQKNQAVDLDSPKLEQNKLQCVSYAPYYRKGYSPLVEGMWIKPSQIEEDLKLLSTISHCVRTYSVSQGLDYVPEAAAKFGMQVYLGAWIGWAHADNVTEIRHAAKAANAYPETVKALIVGNEVFLRQEQDVASMRSYFALAKSLTDIPITYADVWEFWLKYKMIAKDIDFHTVHILPYWENNPVSIKEAASHTAKVMGMMESQFTKPVLIGETGWPSVGRQRSGSEPSIVNQARYIREFIQKANVHNWRYNIIEAIDQPWKRTLEGTVGGYWGLMTADLMPKFSLTEAVSERNDARQLRYIILVGGLLFLAIALILAEQRIFMLIGMSAFGATGFVIAYLCYEYVYSASRNWIEWFALGGLFILGLVLMLLHLLRSINNPQFANKLMFSLKLVFLYAALLTGYLMYFDGRYRDFPILIFAIPVLTMIFDSASREDKTINWLIQAIPAALTVMFAALCFANESTNQVAAIWLALCIFLAYVNWPNQFLLTAAIRKSK